MRLFEIALLVTVVLSMAGYFVPVARRPGWLRLLPVVAVLFLLLHLLLEGHRWQMLPAYALTGTLLLITLVSEIIRRKSVSRKTAANKSVPIALKIIALAGGTLLLLIALALPLSLPMFTVPPPNGPFAVGTTMLEMTDRQRTESFVAETKKPRNLVIKVWYPAAPGADQQPSAYLENAPYWLGYWSRIRSNAYRDAPVAVGVPAWPVLLYSHCYMCPVNQSTVLMEALASHGYIVISIAHPYEEVATVYPNGRSIYGKFDRMTAVRQQFPNTAFYQKMNASDDLSEKERVFRAYLQQAPLTDETLRIWAQDTYFVLDQLQILNAQHSLFADKLDLEKVGVLGYSMGGAVAGQVTVSDKRIKAGINIDCLNFGDMIDSTLVRPFMFIHSEAFKGANALLFARAQGPVYSVVINGTTHQNFSDMTLQAPQLERLSVPKSMEQTVGIVGPIVGTIDGHRAREITNAYVLAFFDKHLRGQNSHLLTGPSPE